MKLLAVLAVTGLLLGASSTAYAARPEPTGEMFLSEGPHVEGGSIYFTFGPTRFIKLSYEVTLGIWCQLPDGTQIPWGNRNATFTYEFNKFGGGFGDQVLEKSLPVYGTGYSCTAGYVTVDWVKGTPVQAWTLDRETFEVVP